MPDNQVLTIVRNKVNKVSFQVFIGPMLNIQSNLGITNSVITNKKNILVGLGHFYDGFSRL